MDKLSHWYSLGWLTRLQMRDCQDLVNLFSGVGNSSNKLTGEWDTADDDDKSPNFIVTFTHEPLEVEVGEQGIQAIWVDGQPNEENLVDIVTKLC